MGNKNPRYDRVSAPDQIIQAEDLAPQAKVVGAPYQQATARNVAEAPTGNSMQQLGAALTSLNPSLNKLNAAYEEKADKRDIEEATAWENERGVERLADGTRKGEFPLGKSQLFKDTVQSLRAKTYADQYGPAFQTWWATQKESQDPNRKPNAMREAQQNFRMDWEQTHNVNPETGNQRFTPHQLALAQYGERMSNTDSHLAQHDANVMQDAHVKQGVETLGLAQGAAIKALTTDMNGNPVPQETWDMDAIAKSLVSPVSDKGTGLSWSGMPYGIANGVTRTSVADFAIKLKDASLIPKLGEALAKLDPKFPLNGTQEWAKMETAATEKIAGANYRELIQREEVAKLEAQGSFTERKAIYEENAKWTQHDTARKRLTETKLSELDSFGDMLKPTKEQADQYQTLMQELYKSDPTTARQYEKLRAAEKEHAKDKLDRKTSDRTEFDLADRVIAHPGDPDVHASIRYALFEEKISGEAARRLIADSDRLSQGGMKYKGLLDNKMFTDLADGVYKGIIPDANQQFGAAPMSAAAGKLQFTLAGIQWLDEHPGAKATDFVKAMEPLAEPIRLKYNKLAKESEDDGKVEQTKRDAITTAKLDESKPENKAVNRAISKTLSKNPHAEPAMKEQLTKAVIEQHRIAKQDKEYTPQFDTILSNRQEQQFKIWKKENAPKDSGEDYDLRGAFKDDFEPNADGHWPDKYKKPNHPTFSDESKYADHNAQTRAKAGHWEGEKFVPPSGKQKVAEKPATVAKAEEPSTEKRLPRFAPDEEEGFMMWYSDNFKRMNWPRNPKDASFDPRKKFQESQVDETEE